MMFQEVNAQLEAIKDMNEIKAEHSTAAEIDDLESHFPVWRVKDIQLVNSLRRSSTLPLFHSSKAHYPHLVVLQDLEYYGYILIVYLQFIWS